MKKFKQILKTTGTKQGTYSIGITAIVLSIVVVVNLIVGQFPEKYRNIDVSSTHIYEISETTEELLQGLEQDVTLTVLAVKENTDERIRTFLSKYAGMSDHVTVEWVDPVLHPSVLQEYEANENTIVVTGENTGKSTQVSFDDIIVQDLYSYYYTGTASETEFDGEGQLTGAIYYVNSDVTKKIYRTSGHGEATPSSTIIDLMDKNNNTVEEWNLLMSAQIPEDCDLLLMYAPTKDLTEDEKAAIETYLSTGGNVMLLLGETNAAELPNLSTLMRTYGLEAVEGYMADPQRAYQGNAYYFFPLLSVSGDMEKGLTSQMILLTNGYGMNLIDPERDSISTQSFMQTSEHAYAVTEESEKEAQYALGVTATETLEDEKESHFTVISAGSLIDAQITDTFPTLENTTLFMNAVTANFDDVENISIEPKSLAVTYNTVQYPGLFSLLVIFGIPILLLGSGFVVWFRRRRA